MWSQNQSVSLLVKADYAGEDARELLQESVTALIGINEDIKNALATLSIKSVFDLATSKVFTYGSLIFEIGQNI